MNFTVDGVRFTIDADKVRSLLRAHSPETLHQYTVTIDETVWPVKQAFSIATGLSYNRFQSQTARRQLRRLGFTINEEPIDEPQPSRLHLSPTVIERSHPADLIESDTVTASVNFTWLSAGMLRLDGSGKPLFPRLPKAPGLYRYTFSPSSTVERTRVYIGESVNLARRASNYRNATRDNTNQRTSRRLHKDLVSHLSIGGSVEFSIASEVFLGVDESSIDLRRSSARRLAENAAVLLAQLNTNNEVLNIDADLPPEDEPAEPNADRRKK